MNDNKVMNRAADNIRILAAAMVVISIACAYTAPQSATEGSVIENAATEQANTNPQNVQGFGAAPQKQATDSAAKK